MKNKKIVALFVILVLVFGITPYFLGNVARENMNKQAEEISKIPGYKLEIREYDQGWFTSHAIIAYGFDEHTLKIMQSPDAEDSLDKNAFAVLQQGLVFDVTIAHGPVSLQNGLDFALLTLSGKLRDIEHEAYREFKTKSGIDSLAKLNAVVSYGGDTTINVHSPAFKVDYAVKTDETITIESAGMDIEATLNAAMDEFDAALSLEKMTLYNETGNLTVSQVKAQSSGEKINDYLWTGTGTSSIGQFNFNAPGGVTLSIEQFTSDYDFDKESETDLTLRGKFTFGELVTREFTLTDFLLDLNFNHLDTEAVTDYVQSIRTMYETTDEAPKTPVEVAAQTQAIATRVGEKLIRNSPELIVKNLSFNLDGGIFSGDATTRLNGDNLQNIQELSNPQTLNRRLETFANILFDKNMAIAITTFGLKKQMAAGGMDINAMPKEQLNQMVNVQASTFLQTFVNQGYLKQDKDQYSTTFALKDGIRLINGKNLPLPGM